MVGCAAPSREEKPEWNPSQELLVLNK